MASKNIMIVGVGGQGTLLTSRILGKLAISAGYDVKLSEVHGMAQRGGSVVTFVRYGEQVAEPIVEEGQADVLIAFERLEALRYLHFLKKDGVVIVNDWRIDPITVVTGVAAYPEDIIETAEGSSARPLWWRPRRRPRSWAPQRHLTSLCWERRQSTWALRRRTGCG